MSSLKPSIPKGTRDFSPGEMMRRNHIFDSIRKVFCLYGYLPLETPAMENLTTLMGKYGEEGDKLLFKILNSGNYLDGFRYSASDLQSPVGRFQELTRHISDKGLRYDLTVPFARYVVQHHHELTFPFKRYQIQPVWRADRPQKGRYREFFQCDVDVIGSDSLLYEVELIQIIDDIFSSLGINVIIRLNNRKILAGIADSIGHPDKLTDLTVILDKFEKIGPENIKKELADHGFPKTSIERIMSLILTRGKINETFTILESFLNDSKTGLKGIEEMNFIMDLLNGFKLRNNFIFDMHLARGLNYYTGTIIEVKAKDTAIGSLCGGGRYDDLTGIFGLKDMPGVGISFGADRIYDVMQELNLFPEAVSSATQALFINFGKEESKFCFSILPEFRTRGIAVEIYPESTKIKKQMDYANRKNIPFVVLIGQDEMKSGRLTVKKMKTGEQDQMTLEELIQTLTNTGS